MGTAGVLVSWHNFVDSSWLWNYGLEKCRCVFLGVSFLRFCLIFGLHYLDCKGCLWQGPGNRENEPASVWGESSVPFWWGGGRG